MAKKHEPKQTQTTPNADSRVDSSSPKAELSDGELESVTGGAVDMFLKIDGIKGEVGTGTQYKGEIDSYSWGVSQTGVVKK